MLITHNAFGQNGGNLGRRVKRRQAVESLIKNNIAPRASKLNLNYSCITPKFIEGIALFHQVFACN
jgi:signal recognition particle subunit SEC65